MENKFGIKYVMPAAAAFLTFVVIWQFYMTSINEGDLVAIKGKVTSIFREDYPRYKGSDSRVNIELDNAYGPLQLHDKRYFTVVMHKVRIGDTVTIYHRTKNQVKLGTGNMYMIMQIQKGSDMIYSFEKAKEAYSRTGWFTMVGALVLWVLYLYSRNRIKVK